MIVYTTVKEVQLLQVLPAIGDQDAAINGASTKSVSLLQYIIIVQLCMLDGKTPN